MALHLQELEGVRNCNQEWEELLRGKLKEAQKEKQQLEEEIAELKLSAREKLKRMKEENGKKILQLA